MTPHKDSAARATQARVPDAPNRLRWSSLRHLLGLLAFWLLVMGGLYAAMARLTQPPRTTVTADGTLVIPRQNDGHFRVAGTINGQPVMFMVDTGASVIFVSEALAQRAGLPDGERTVFRTANGLLDGRVTRAQSVTLEGGLHVTNLRVGAGLVGMDSDRDALLGQNFLRHFDMEVSQSEMRLRPR